MGKTILGLILCVSLLGNVPKKEFPSKIYYDVYANGDWKVGSAERSEGRFDLKIMNSDHIEFVREGDFYFEALGRESRRERYDYHFDKNWIFDKYSCESKKIYKSKDNKIKAEGRVMPFDAKLAVDIFSLFDGIEIPDTLEVIAFSYPYIFIKNGYPRYKEDFVEVDYRLDNYVRHSSDIRILKGDITAMLKKNPDSTYRIFGAKFPFLRKGFLDINMDIEIRERE
jgi:hypothetical protein